MLVLHLPIIVLNEFVLQASVVFITQKSPLVSGRQAQHKLCPQLDPVLGESLAVPVTSIRVQTQKICCKFLSTVFFSQTRLMRVTIKYPEKQSRAHDRDLPKADVSMQRTFLIFHVVF